MPLRACDGPGLPVDLECRDVVAFAGLGLPARIRADRADQLDPVLDFGVDQQVDIDIAGIDQVDLRQKVLCPQRLVHRRSHGHVRHRRRCGLDMHNQPWRAFIAGFREVHDPSAINAIVFTMSVAFAWPAIAKPRRRRLRPS